MGHYDSCYEFDEKRLTGGWFHPDITWPDTYTPQIDFAKIMKEVEELAKKPAPTSAQPHYAALKPEPIDVIEGWSLNFYRANAVKYIARAGKKDTTTEGTIKDLEKAISYLKREVNALRGTPGW